MFLCGKPLIFSACSQAFILLIDMHTKKPFIPDLLQLQMSLCRKRQAVLCVRMRLCVSVRVRTFEDVIIRKESTLSWRCCSNSFTGLWLPEHRQFYCLCLGTTPQPPNLPFMVYNLPDNFAPPEESRLYDLQKKEMNIAKS